MKNIVDNPGLQRQTLRLIQSYPTAVTVGFIAYNLKVHYSTAKTILLTLLTQGRIEGERTTHGWIFRQKKAEEEVPVPRLPTQRDNPTKA